MCGRVSISLQDLCSLLALEALTHHIDGRARLRAVVPLEHFKHALLQPGEVAVAIVDGAWGTRM